MAHVAKYKKANCGGLFAHYERKIGPDGNYIKFQNQDIDTSRTYLNYNLCHEHKLTQNQFLKKRMDEIKHNHRKTQNVMCDWVVTLPDDVKPEDEKKFFQETYDFLADKYGYENIISSWVHCDEKKPHMHFAFMPVLEEENKLDCKSIINRNTLRTFHQEYKKHMDYIMGYDVGILKNDDVERNLTLDQYKAKKLQEENIKLQEQNKALIEQNEKLKNDYSNLLKRYNNTLKHVKMLIESIQPIERLRSLLHVAKSFIDDFSAFLDVVKEDYKLDSNQIKQLADCKDLIENNTADQLDQMIDDVIDLQKKINPGKKKMLDQEVRHNEKNTR